jgi:hypothetical protein
MAPPSSLFLRGWRPPFRGSDAPVRVEEQELLAAPSATIHAPDPRAICGDAPEGHDVDAQAVRAEAQPRFLEWRARIVHGDDGHGHIACPR